MARTGYGKGHVELLTERTKRELNIDAMTLAVGSHTKIYVRCRRCAEEFLREYRNLNQKHACPTHIIRADGVKLKWCNSCTSFLTYKSFIVNAARHDGFSSLCKTCVGRQPKTRRHNAAKTAARLTLDGWMRWTAYRKRSECRKRGIEFNIDIDYLREVYDKQQGLCFYSRVKLEFGTTNLRSASLERLDSKLGYVRGNVALASKAMNWAKNNSSEGDFIEFILEMLSGLSQYVRLETKIVDAAGRLPFRRRASDAGYDISSIEEVVIEPHRVVNVNTGLIVSPPDGTYYSVEGRSSLWLKGIMPLRGIIDGTYTGHLMIAVANNSDSAYVIHSGDRIAQIVLHEIINADFVEVAEFSPHCDGRNEAGFGSSGR